MDTLRIISSANTITGADRPRFDQAFWYAAGYADAAPDGIDPVDAHTFALVFVGIGKLSSHHGPAPSVKFAWLGYLAARNDGLVRITPDVVCRFAAAIAANAPN
jgi:hypothetical protein